MSSKITDGRDTTRGVTGDLPTTCAWRDCAEPATIVEMDPDWCEGGLVGFCSEDHLRWYTYAVTA